MARTTGVYRASIIGGEKARAFMPHPLPTKNPSLKVEGDLAETHNSALAAIRRLKIASAMVPSPEWFLYGFVRKEAVVSSQIEGTQSTLEDVSDDRRTLVNLGSATVSANRLFERLPEHPMITAAKALELTTSTKPTTNKAIDSLVEAGILEEITGKQRDRIYAYRKYLDVLAEDTESLPG